jgi:hypothetical protein
MNKKRLLPVLLAPTCVVMILAAAMLFSFEGWVWDTTDFIVDWIFIAGAVAAYHLWQAGHAITLTALRPASP